MRCRHCYAELPAESRVACCKFHLVNHETGWHAILPAASIYNSSKIDILMAKFPAFVPKYDKVMLWTQHSDRGLIVYGDNGCGKSRACWLKLRRLYDDGVRVRGLTAVDFAASVNTEFRSGNGPEWIQSITDCQVLYIDDIDKMVMTERVQSELYNVIERITASGGRLIVSSNLVGDQFVNLFLPHIGPAIARRIREFCIPVNFSVQR